MTEEIKTDTEVVEEKVQEVEAVANDFVKKSTSDGSRMQNLMVGVVGALVIMAGIQVFQTQQLMAAVSNGTIKATGQAQQQQQGSGIGVQSQVGGCG